MKCAECPYWWKSKNEDTPSCHYGYDDGCAPCEVEDDFTPDDYYEN